MRTRGPAPTGGSERRATCALISGQEPVHLPPDEAGKGPEPCAVQPRGENLDQPQVRRLLVLMLAPTDPVQALNGQTRQPAPLWARQRSLCDGAHVEAEFSETRRFIATVAECRVVGQRCSRSYVITAVIMDG
ncbi:hypothetical protein EYF80_030564 [Liparis tanakae]|uniref:Uncharacterized protein n=1 Tax=Liparis tanakae TaxID=230148 RepID=A0A4Z2H0S3_9TELE|nr:hypothetical protein EYF80_030564 [Liparis tanakae]